MNNTLKTLGLAATLLISGCYTTKDLQNGSSREHRQLEERVENTRSRITDADSLETRTQTRRGNTRTTRGNVRGRPTIDESIRVTNSGTKATTLDEQLERVLEITYDEQARPSTTQTPQYIHASPIKLSGYLDSSLDWIGLMRDEVPSMARKYFGLPPEKRELLMFNDLYETKGELAKYELGEHETQEAANRQDWELQTRIVSQANRIYELEEQLDHYRTKANTQETKIVQEPCYEPQVIRQGPISTIDHQIADEDVAVRVGDDYIVLPFAGIVCPPKDGEQKACLSIQDIIEDFKARDVNPYERP